LNDWRTPWPPSPTGLANRQTPQCFAFLSHFHLPVANHCVNRSSTGPKILNCVSSGRPECRVSSSHFSFFFPHQFLIRYTTNLKEFRIIIFLNGRNGVGRGDGGVGVLRLMDNVVTRFFPLLSRWVIRSGLVIVVWTFVKLVWPLFNKSGQPADVLFTFLFLFRFFQGGGV
jgi:hypothetical protein